jgi:cytochrome c-type biogenesis protein CcmH/NrfG
VRGWLNLAQALELLEPASPSGALEAYRRALALKPQDPAAVLTIGKRLVDLGDLASALDACARATEIAPGLPAAWRELAWVLMHPDGEPGIRDASRAREAARKAVELSGGSDPAMLDTLAHAESAAGDQEAAVRTATAAVAAAAADPERKEETVRLQASLDRLRSAASRPAAR